MTALSDSLKTTIRDIPDFPKPDLFKDITPVLSDASLMAAIVDHFAAAFREAGVTAVVGMESADSSSALHWRSETPDVRSCLHGSPESYPTIASGWTMHSSTGRPVLRCTPMRLGLATRCLSSMTFWRPAGPRACNQRTH